MAQPMLRATWLLVALVALPGWLLSFYVLPLNLMAVVPLFALGFFSSRGRALDAFMLTVAGGLVLVAILFTLVLDDPGGRRAAIAIAAIILASALLVMKCGAVYGQQRWGQQHLATPLPIDPSVADRHRVRRGGRAAVSEDAEGSRLLTMLGGACVTLTAFVAVGLLLLMAVQNMGG